MKALLRRAGRLALLVVHDKQVDRAGKALAGLIALRVAVALGAGAGTIAIVHLLFGV